MKRVLNTLYVTSQGAYLSKDGDAVEIRVDGEVKMHVPIHNLESLVCFGNVLCTPFLLGLCGRNNVSVSFLSERGRFLSRAHGPVSGNVLLRREQYRRADTPDKSVRIARSILLAKLSNCRTVLMRAARESKSAESGAELQKVADSLARIARRVSKEESIDTLRGIEGLAANGYFSVFNHLIVAQKTDFVFEARSRRPPLDRINALLSFLYTLIVHDVASALESVGLDPAVGYLHAVRPGRPSLALDLAEEFRPFLGDRMALTLVNRSQLSARHFTKTASGAVYLDEKGRKALLTAYQKRKQETIHHAFLDEKASIGLIPHLQALLLARYLRGDLDDYPAFFWR